ncbi:DEAD/DEAH box helicase [Parabacteroides distasonis]|nr:DEAD/DEAH box helicase [Parabacteroides distasonis]
MLRDYQQQICEQVRLAFGRHRSVLVQMPTGTGKTVVLASLIGQERNAGKGPLSVLIVAHRRELIEQIKSTIRRMGLDTSHLWVESIQTVSRRITSGQMQIRPALIVIDEAHHALARTYQLLWQQWPKARFLGLTATPYRLNGAGFTDLFDELISSASVARFMAEGWLSPFDYYSIPPESEESRAIASLRKRNVDGDYQTKEMRELLDVRPTLERLYASQREFAPNRKGIVYAIDIAHAEHIADFYRSRGLSAKAISAATPKQERASDLERFKAGAIEVLVNVDLFSEGFDCPDVEFIQLARPTLSLAKYLQMVGRGLRRYEGKSGCIILDNVGLYRRFGLPSDERDWTSSFLGGQKRPESLEQALFSLRCLDGSERLREQYEQEDTPLIRIVSQDRMNQLAKEGSDFVRQGKVWTDPRNGITFRSSPVSLLFRGVELSTDDGETFYPRIRSVYVRPDRGISRRCLEMQMGKGLFWQGLLIPANRPDSIFKMEKRLPSGIRIFQSATGIRCLQETPDHPVRVVQHQTEQDQWVEAWEMALEKGNREIDRLVQERKARYHRIMKEVHQKGSLKITYLEGDIARVCSEEGRLCWIDRRTGFVHDSQPRLFKRGFLELLQEGEMLFVRNVRDATCYPYPSYRVSADDEVCIIGDRLFLRQECCMGSYKVKYRSDDFTYFRTGTNRYQRDYETDVEITHKPGTNPIVKLHLKPHATYPL